MQKKVFAIDGNRIDRQRTLNQIKESVGDHTLFVFDSSNSYEFVSQFITDLNLFDDKTRLVVLNELPLAAAKERKDARLKAITGFIKIIPMIPAGNVLVFNNVGVEAKKFVDTINQYGEVFHFNQKVDIKDAGSVIFEYFRKREKTIHPQDVTMLSKIVADGSTSVDLDVLNLALLKLDHYTGKRSKIDQEDIFSIFEHYEKFIIWRLYTLLEDKQYSEAITFVSRYMDMSSNTLSTVLELLGSMIWRYGGLLCMKSAKSQGYYDNKMIAEVSSILKVERDEDDKSKKDIKMRYSLKKDKTKGDDQEQEKGNPYPMYSEKMIEGVIEGWGRSRSSLEDYSLIHLSIIYCTLIHVLMKIRTGCTESEWIVSLHLIMLLICKKITRGEDLKMLMTPLFHQLNDFTVGYQCHE
jgi:DNA polymerase III delta subunit